MSVVLLSTRTAAARASSRLAASAAELAIRFYSGLGDGLSIERCWQDAEHQLLSRKGKGNLRTPNPHVCGSPDIWDA